MPIQLLKAMTTMKQRVPRQRLTHLAFALLANAMGDQQGHISRRANLQCQDCEHIDECDICFLAGELRWLTLALWPTQ